MSQPTDVPANAAVWHRGGVTRIKVRLALVVTAGTLVLAGCSNALPGTAAIVGADRVTVDSLQSQVDAVLAYRGGQPGSTVRSQLPTITQQVLSGDVLHQLAQTAVARTHLAVDEKAIAGQIAKLDPKVIDGQGLTFLTPTSLPQFVRDQLVIAQLGTASWDGLAVTADLASATDEADAEAKAKRMAQSPQEAQAVVAESTAKGEQARANYPLSPSALEGLAGSPVFATPAGSAVAFQLQQQQQQQQQQQPQWQVARILTRTTTAAPSTAPNAVSAAQAQPNSTYSLGISLVQELAGNPEVRVNPRYGNWDPTQGQVVAASAPPTTIVFNSRP